MLARAWQTRSPEDVAAALERVARRRAEDEPSWIEEALEWIFDRFGAEAVFNVWEGLLWVFLAVLGGAFLVWGGRAIRALPRRSAAARGAARGASVEERVAALRAEALAASARGELRLALRLEIFALVLGLGERGDLRYRDAWTNRELLARGQPSPEVEAMLAPLVAELEGKEFGDESVTGADVERVRALCARHLGPMTERAA